MKKKQPVKSVKKVVTPKKVVKQPKDEDKKAGGNDAMMKTRRNFFNTVVTQVAGDEVTRITDFLKDKKNVSEFIIAEKTKIEIHRARMLLYKLLEHNLASFKRKKDKEKGWYICYWDLTPKNAGHTMNKLKREKLDKMRDRLQAEKENQYYMCKNACIRMTFEKSVDFEFKCPECGELMNLLDNKRTIEFLEKSIEDLSKELTTAG